MLALLLAARVAHAAPPTKNLEPEALARWVTIYRDTYGVPHIYGPTDASVVFGLMYAQAEDNFAQLEDDYIRALGRAAEAQRTSATQRDFGRQPGAGAGAPGAAGTKA